MRSIVLIVFSVVALGLPSVAQVDYPVDECGVLRYVAVEGGCWVFNDYEIHGSWADYGDGDTVRVIGNFALGFSFCMVANCCLTPDTVLPCGPCCQGMTGNADGSASDLPNVSDLTAMVAMLFGARPIICWPEVDVDGSGAPGSDLTIADITYLVAYLFGGGPAPVDCP